MAAPRKATAAKPAVDKTEALLAAAERRKASNPHLAALLYERQGYVTREGMQDQVAAVDEQLAYHLGTLEAPVVEDDAEDEEED